MRKAAILLLMAALAVPARAADDAQKGGKPGTNVEMPFLMAPLSDADGKLIGYAYVSTRLTAMSDIYALAVRDKLPFIQDKMVRDVNNEVITTPDDPEKVDIAGLERRLLADADPGNGCGQGQADHGLHRTDRGTSPHPDAGAQHPARPDRPRQARAQKPRQVPLRRLIFHHPVAPVSWFGSSQAANQAPGELRNQTTLEFNELAGVLRFRNSPGARHENHANFADRDTRPRLPRKQAFGSLRPPLKRRVRL